MKLLLPLLFCISMGASCQIKLITSGSGKTWAMRINDNTTDGLSNPNKPKVIYKWTSVIPKDNPVKLSFNFAMGRTSFFYSHGNGSDPFSVSVELEAKNKIGYVQFRQSFFHDQPVFNDYSNPNHKPQVEWIEQLGVHVYFLKTGSVKATVGGAIQYQWGKLLRDNRFRLFPEMSLYYSIDERVSAFTREAWFHFRDDNRLGFMFGLNCKIGK